ncbi:MAG: SagB/ThcOx family dehydrogenase [Candidatus Heimdallarchaeota archaeon]|nr:SagB/ThcOx family dehydrogenase [Candidatus Heimdallarchaeota archaeon]MBY8993910.1 SagB/ThcOx family dehydrogenase [Candidatus Heimdallarchaeota archaeon]
MKKGIGQEFMEKTKYKYLDESDQRKGVTNPPLQTDYDTSKKIIDLPAPEKIDVPKWDLRKAIEERKSVRKYSPEALTLNELAWLLWATQGIKEVGKIWTKRTVPSAGARHAFETYLLINNVEDLKPGVYRYLALEHKLVEIDLTEDIADRVVEGAYGQNMVKAGAVTFIWVAIPYRIAWRYGQRSYRYLHLDIGHVAQNLYLAVENIDSGCCAIAAFYDEKMNDILGIDGEEQFVIYMASMGKRSEKKKNKNYPKG